MHQMHCRTAVSMLNSSYKALFRPYASVQTGATMINFVMPRSLHIGDARWRLRQSTVRSRLSWTKKRRRAGKNARAWGNVAQ